MLSRIIVLGVLRSGTSLTTKLIQRWGAYTGREDDLFGDRYGYLEHLGLQRLNDDLMDNNDRIPPRAELLIERSQDPSYQDRARQLLQTMDEQTKEASAIAWVWKDPRLPMLLPFWVNLWGEVSYVITVRHPLETILSGANMEGIPTDDLPYSAGFIYWQYNMLNVLSHTEACPRKIFMAYDQLIKSPREECMRLGRFLDEQCGSPGADFDHRIAALVSEVQAGQHHYRESRSLAQVEQTMREQRALYNFLRVKTIYPSEAFNQDDFALYPGWREYLQAVDTLLSLSQASES